MLSVLTTELTLLVDVSSLGFNLEVSADGGGGVGVVPDWDSSNFMSLALAASSLASESFRLKALILFSKI